MLQLSTYGTKIWGGDFGPLEGFREGQEDTYGVSRRSLFFENLPNFCWPGLENFPLNYMLIKGFQQQIAHPTSSWLIKQATLLSRYLAEHGVPLIYLNNVIKNQFLSLFANVVFGS